MPSPRDLLEKLLARRDLSQVEAEELLTHLTNPDGAPALAGAILAGLRSKGVVADEVRQLAQRLCALAECRLQPVGRVIAHLAGDLLERGGEGFRLLGRRAFACVGFALQAL